MVCRCSIALALLLTVPAAADAQLATELVALADAPTFIAAPPIAGEERLFILERDGRIQILENDAWVVPPFLDLTACVPPDCVDIEGEGGMLGLAFSPDYELDGTFYVHYTAGDPAVTDDLETRVSRFQVVGDPATSNLADASSEEIIFSVAQPRRFHNAGDLAIWGDDLYVGLGDGGGTSNTSQDDSSLFGKMLRLDLTMQPPSVEVVAKGLRNPYRYSFDSLTGDLYISDVGADLWEEINVVAAADLLVGVPLGMTAPLNFGWDVEEGPFCHGPNPPGEPQCGESIPPTFAFDHASNGARRSVIGGFVYRGSIPSIRGEYFFADLASLEFWSFEWNAAQGIVGPVKDRSDDFFPPLSGSINRVWSFGTDAQGELYLADPNGGIFMLVPDPGRRLLTAVSLLAVVGLSARSRRRID
jgi:glucose/arabinose dehydrogenase